MQSYYQSTTDVNNDKLISCCVIGASGYTGAELCCLIERHPQLSLSKLLVSESSEYAHQSFSDIYGRWKHEIDHIFEPLTDQKIMQVAQEFDAIFLCTAHDVSMNLVSKILSYATVSGNLKQAPVIFDLSGAYRLKDGALYSQYYGFEHNQFAHLEKAVYGLAEWHSEAIKKANLVAVPGCYPTAAATGLMPLIATEIIDASSKPIINAVSGISGAGKKPSHTNLFCELSLKPYNLFSHRHLPEIEQQLGISVVFTPHISDFDRGILATIYCQVKDGVTLKDINGAFNKSYEDAEYIRIVSTPPSIANVKHTPYCDVYWQKDPNSNQVIIVTAIDNLLKGAASQAIQCAELRYFHDQ